MCYVIHPEESGTPNHTLHCPGLVAVDPPRWCKASLEGRFDAISKALPFGSAIQQFQLYLSILRGKNRTCIYVFISLDVRMVIMLFIPRANLETT